MKKLIAICGQSASGKDTILRQLLKQYPDTFHRKVSYTTRAPREGEVDGEDYWFISREEFFQRVLNEDMLEAVEFQGEVYGTSLSSLVDDKVNVGIFDPEGIDILTGINEIELIPFYIYVSDGERIKRSIDRDSSISIDELYERYKYDRKKFNGINDFPRMFTLRNEDTKMESLLKIIKDMAYGLTQE